MKAWPGLVAQFGERGDTVCTTFAWRRPRPACASLPGICMRAKQLKVQANPWHHQCRQQVNGTRQLDCPQIKCLKVKALMCWMQHRCLDCKGLSNSPCALSGLMDTALLQLSQRQTQSQDGPVYHNCKRLIRINRYVYPTRTAQEYYQEEGSGQEPTTR